MNKKILIGAGVLVLILAFFVFLLGDKNTNTSESVSDVNQIPFSDESTPSLDGVSGNEKMFSMDEVVTHNTPESCYTAINGLVYDVTAWINEHPGGDKNILKLCGIDGTAAFTRKHGANQKAKDTLEGFNIGILGEQ